MRRPLSRRRDAKLQTSPRGRALRLCLLLWLGGCGANASPGGAGGDDPDTGGSPNVGGSGGARGEPDASASAGSGGGAGAVGDDASAGGTGTEPDTATAEDAAPVSKTDGPPASGGTGGGTLGDKLLIDSLDGEVTLHEASGFLAAASAITIPTTQYPGGSHNYLADGTGGRNLEAINRLAEITGEIPALADQHREILDLAIKWSDVWLTHRDDQPLGEHRKVWTGNVEPVWPPDAPPSINAACEVGETVGILAYTALNMAKDKSLWDQTVPDGDPNKYGATYRARLQTYETMLELTMDKFLNANFLNMTTLTIQHPNNAAYNTIGANNVNAWNREMMFAHSWNTLGELHALLGDDAAKATMYKTITENVVDVFVKNAIPSKAPDGTAVYDWGYGNYGDWMHGSLRGELLGIHAQFDIWGLTRAYRAGYTHATADQMKIYGDTVSHVIQISPGQYASKVDGGGVGYTYLPAGFMYLAPYSPEIYQPAAMADLKSGRQQTSPDLTASILWAKHYFAGAH